MFSTEYQIKAAIAVYLIVFINSILIVISAKRLSLEDRIIRLIITILLPIIGPLIVTAESFIQTILLLRKKGTSNTSHSPRIL